MIVEGKKFQNGYASDSRRTDAMAYPHGLAGEFCFTILVSVELRGGIPFGAALGLPVPAAFLAAVIGNMIPVPFIVVYIHGIFLWMRRRAPKLNAMVDRLEKKAHLKGRLVTKYKAIPHNAKREGMW